jgi:membrane-associated phospholipid phosphatase
MQAVSTARVPAVPLEYEPVGNEWRVPVLEAKPGGVAEMFPALVGRRRHPVLVFFIALVGGLILLTVLSIGAGFLLTRVLTHLPGVASANDDFVAWLARHRTPDRTDASLIGSIMAGGVTLPIVVAVIGIVCGVFRKWRIAAFSVFGLIVESSAYRATTLVFHEHRPRVVRLETLPVNASYPSGHTAASIAVYGGLVLLLTSRFTNRWLRACAWIVACAIPVFVGLSRMYRGMHHPLDVTGGALLGIAALCVIVFACRTAGAAHDWRARNQQ